MIVVFGSINLDLIFPLPRLPVPGETLLGPNMTIEPGGKGANQAVAAARDGAQVVFAGAVGGDALANDALQLMHAAEIDTSRVAKASSATGCAAICVDPEGQNLIAVASGANLFARHTQVESALLGPTTTLLLQMEVSRAETEALIRRARNADCRVILNLAPGAPLDEDALRAVDILILNEGEAAFLAAHLACLGTAEALHTRLGVTVVVTLGEKGLESASGGRVVRLPVHSVAAIDTTGAGDCFCGVLAADLDRGADLFTALFRANVAAALCCTRLGTQGSMPSRSETDAVLKK